MLIPQYTIRWLLALTAAAAVAFSVFGLALRGSGWAQGVSMAIVSLVVVLLVHGFVFTLVWLSSVLTAGWLGRWGGAGRSPFVRDAIAAKQTGPAPAGGKETPATPIILE